MMITKTLKRPELSRNDDTVWTTAQKRTTRYNTKRIDVLQSLLWLYRHGRQIPKESETNKNKPFLTSWWTDEDSWWTDEDTQPTQ